MVSFLLQPDHESVLISKDGDAKAIRVPLSLATHVWMTQQTRNCTGPFVVLSYAIPPAIVPQLRANPLFVCISNSGTGAPPWPSWHPEEPPQWLPLKTSPEWRTLPVAGGDVQAVLEKTKKERTDQERDTEKGIQERCASIKQQGEDASFVESLDFYTTNRVKLAYLRLNAHNLQKRRMEVENTINSVVAVLLRADPSLAGQWHPPSCSLLSPLSDANAPADPNALCVPELSDYELPGDGNVAECSPTGGPRVLESADRHEGDNQ